MTRLDQLSQPRAPRAGAAAANELPQSSPSSQQQQQQRRHSKGLDETSADVSKSMTHLAAATGGGGAGRCVGGEKPLKRGAATSKSMVHLGPPRMTRAERLRKLAREGTATCPTPTSAKLQAPSPPGKIERMVVDYSLVVECISLLGRVAVSFPLNVRTAINTRLGRK